MSPFRCKRQNLTLRRIIADANGSGVTLLKELHCSRSYIAQGVTLLKELHCSRKNCPARVRIVAETAFIVDARQTNGDVKHTPEFTVLRAIPGDENRSRSPPIKCTA